MSAIATLLGEVARKLSNLIDAELRPRGICFVLVLVDPESEHHVVRANMNADGVTDVLKQVREKMVTAAARATLPDRSG
jgi:hypothetical protein